MQNLRTGAVILAIVTLAACGGSPPQPVRAADVAKLAGCAGYRGGTTQMFTQETGDCQIDGHDIYVMTFRDSSMRDQWMKVAPAGGGFFGEGDLWVLQGDDHDAVAKGVKAAGGKMV